jgi:hypothetical protein
MLLTRSRGNVSGLVQCQTPHMSQARGEYRTGRDAPRARVPISVSRKQGAVARTRDSFDKLAERVEAREMPAANAAD